MTEETYNQRVEMIRGRVDELLLKHGEFTQPWEPYDGKSALVAGWWTYFCDIFVAHFQPHALTEWGDVELALCIPENGTVFVAGLPQTATCFKLANVRPNNTWCEVIGVLTESGDFGLTLPQPDAPEDEGPPLPEAIRDLVLTSVIKSLTDRGMEIAKKLAEDQVLDAEFARMQESHSADETLCGIIGDCRADVGFEREDLLQEWGRIKYTVEGLGKDDR